MRKVPLAIIGLGPASQPHMLSLHDLKDRAELVWAWSRSEPKTKAFTEKYGVPATTDIGTIIDDKRVEAVLLLTPPNAHLEFAERFFASGKHVLVEKPLEVSLDRAERLVAAGRASKKRLGVVLQHRFRPGSLRLRECLQSGALGKVEAATMLVPWWRPQSYYDEPGRGTMVRDGGGVLLTQAIHTLDLFRSLVGISGVDAAQVKRTSVHKMETEDYVAALVRLGDGGCGTIMTTTAFNPGLPERIEVIGSKGSAALVGNDLKIAWIDGKTEEIKGDSRTGGGASIMDFSHEPHRAVLTDFLDAVVEDRDPAVSGEEALASQRVVYDVLKRGGWS